MRRKLSKLLLMITVVCMSVMTLVLAACSNTGNEPQKPAQDNTKVNTVTMLKDVISNLKASYALDKTFGIDVAAKYLQDDKNDDTEDAKFELIAKGNVDVNDDANENATNFVIELNKVGAESKETMFGIAYEVIDGKPYFFVNLLNGGYEKINGFSILSLYKMANAQVAGGAGGINIESLIAYVAPILFGDTGKVDSGVYTFNFDLANLVNEIEGFIPLLTGALNMSTEDLDSLVAIFCKNMTFSSGEAVDSLADLVDYVNTEMSFSGTIAVKFDADKKFTSSSLTFDYANGDEGKTYTFSVDKAFVGTTNTPIDTFNGFALTEDARKQNQAYNLLNFSLDGEAMAIGGAHDGVKYSINVESDLDPFVFFGLLESTSKENILACLNKMGYFHLQIDELQADGQVKNNVITIHTKSEEGFAVISVNPYHANILNLPLGIGGVYNFDALIDVIGMLTAPKGATATADGGINIGALLTQIMGYIHADDIATNGVTIDLKALVHGLLPALGVALDDTLGGIVDAVLGSDSMNIKLANPTFGSCEAVETAELVNSLASIRTKYKANGEDYIKEITSVENFIATTVLQGDDLFEKYLGKASSGAYPGLKGMSIDNKEVNTSGYIMGIQGYDANKAGKQKVTLYIAIATDVKSTLTLAGSVGVQLEVDPLIPLSGVLKYETEIEVLAFESSRNVEIKNMKEGYVVLEEGTNLVSELQSGKDKLIMSIDGLEFPIDDCTISVFENGKDVTEQVYVNKKIAKHGYYTVKFDYRGYCVEKVIGVAGIETTGEAVTEIKLGTEFVNNYKFVTYAENGEKQYPEAILSYKLGSTKKNESDLFDNQEGKLILKKDMDFVGKTLNVVLSYNGLELMAGPEIVGAKVSTKPSTMYFLDNKKIEFAVNVDGKVFTVKYDLAQAKWVAVSGEETKEVAVTLEWKKKGSGDNVQFDEKGQIVYKNDYKSGSRSNAIYYTITIDGCYYSSYFSAYELYASNKTSHKIDATLDGYISYVNKIYYEKDGQKVELEFKYGKDGYAIYEKGTDVKVYDVTVKVTKDSQEVQLVDGKFAEIGTYKIEYEMTINGINQKFYHDVTVK